METLILTTFVIIIFFSFANLVISSLIYFTSKRDLYLRASFFWLSLIINFFIQSIAQGSETAIIMGYGFSVVPLNLLPYASVYFSNTKYPWKFFSLLAIAGLGTSAVFLQYDSLSFLVKSMPLAIATAAPLLYAAYVYFISKRQHTTTLMKFHACVLIIIAIHCFNFSFFRMDPNAQLWGWPVSYALYQLLAAIIPAMSLDFYHRQEKKRLTETINERTRELHESNKYLSKTLKDKDFLFKTLVHDVSNPLSVIQGRIKIHHVKKDTDKFVGVVDSMVGRINSLIAQVKDLEKNRAGEMNLALTEIPLEANMSSLVSLFEEKLQRKKINFEYDEKSSADIFVLAEEKTFSNSIVPNILNNAIKFTHQGGTIKLQVEMINEGSCKISITDDGIGIPEETLKNIFDFDAETTRLGTSGEKGTGFGLPIIKELVEKSGGQIFIDTQEETADQKGFTTVSVVFKAIKRSAQVSYAQQQAA